MHILLLLESHFPATGGGGAEGQVRTLARGLRAHGHRVTIVTPLARRGPQERVSRVDGIPVCRLAYPQRRYIGGLILWLQLVLFLWRRRHRYDAWHAHIVYHFAAITSLLGSLLGKPVVLKVAGDWETRHALSDTPSLLSRVAFACLVRAHAWQAISRRIGTSLVARGVPADRVVVIPNAVDTARFRRVENSESPYLRFVFIGRLVHQKALDVLLDAFSSSLGHRPYAQLRIVGTGPLQAMLERRVWALGLERRVQFDGHRSDIGEVLAQADFSLLPSRVEGLSNTLLECMAAGVPIIASRVSGSEDLVRSGDNGWLCEPDDRGGLGRCLEEAAGLTPAQRNAMGERARQTVERYASLDRVVERLIVLYRGVERPASTIEARASGDA